MSMQLLKSFINTSCNLSAYTVINATPQKMKQNEALWIMIIQREKEEKNGSPDILN